MRGGDGFANGESGVLEGTSVLQSEFSMVDVDGQTLANALVSLTLTDQCGNLTTFEQNVQRAVVVPHGVWTGLCAALCQLGHPDP